MDQKTFYPRSVAIFRCIVAAAVLHIQIIRKSAMFELFEWMKHNKPTFEIA